MRFVTFDDGLDELVGVLSNDRVIPLAGSTGDLVDLIEAGAAALDLTRAELAVSRDKGLALADVQLLAPLRRFRREIMCTRWNGSRPEFSTRCPETLITYDPAAPTELAVVIGRAGRDIPSDSALNHAWGYTLANRTDANLAIGPWVITPDEVDEPGDVATLIAELSAETMLRPGDLLLTGGVPRGFPNLDLAMPSMGERS
jgi:hypothetical protein